MFWIVGIAVWIMILIWSVLVGIAGITMIRRQIVARCSVKLTLIVHV